WIRHAALAGGGRVARKAGGRGGSQRPRKDATGADLTTTRDRGWRWRASARPASAHDRRQAWAAAARARTRTRGAPPPDRFPRGALAPARGRLRLRCSTALRREQPAA